MIQLFYRYFYIICCQKSALYPQKFYVNFRLFLTIWFAGLVLIFIDMHRFWFLSTPDDQKNWETQGFTDPISINETNRL